MAGFKVGGGVEGVATALLDIAQRNRAKQDEEDKEFRAFRQKRIEATYAAALEGKIPGIQVNPEATTALLEGRSYTGSPFTTRPAFDPSTLGPGEEASVPLPGGGTRKYKGGGGTTDLSALLGSLEGPISEGGFQPTVRLGASGEIEGVTLAPNPDIRKGKFEAQNALGLIDQIFEKADELIPPSGRGPVAIGGGLVRKVGGAVGLDESTRAFQQYKEGTLSLTIRGLGERGVLTDQDVARARKLLPDVTDSTVVRQTKKQALRELLQNRLNQMQGRTTSGNNGRSGRLSTGLTWSVD